MSCAGRSPRQVIRSVSAGLSDDLTEEWDVMARGLDCGWVLASASQRLGAYMKSAARYPNVKHGEDFEGYRQTGFPE